MANNYVADRNIGKQSIFPFVKKAWLTTSSYVTVYSFHDSSTTRLNSTYKLTHSTQECISPVFYPAEIVAKVVM